MALKTQKKDSQKTSTIFPTKKRNFSLKKTQRHNICTKAKKSGFFF
jgi:hypothetical protein